MTPRSLLPLLATALFLPAAGAAAQDAAGTDAPARSAVTVGVTGGSLGIGPEIDFRPVPLLGIRASATFLNFGRDLQADDVDYEGDLRLRSWGASVDLYPFESSFRISGGLRSSRNRITMLATPASPVLIGGTAYTPQQVGTLETEIRARKLAPTVTLGVARNQRRGFAWSVDAGVMLHGTPRTEPLRATGLLASNPLFQANLAREQAEIQDEIEDYKLYPIAQLAVGYTF